MDAARKPIKAAVVVKSMAANRRRDTTPELALRRALFARGLRFRVDYPIRVGHRRPIRPDIVFPRVKVAIFVDGCYWHGCDDHGSVPKSNTQFWLDKIERNRERDREQTGALRGDNWSVLRFWEHESVNSSAATIAALVANVDE